MAISKVWKIIPAITLLLYVLSSSADNSVRQLSILTSFPPDFYKIFQSNFTSLHPDIQVTIRNKKTTAGIKYLLRQPDNVFDLFWASAPDAFAIIDNAGLLKSVNELEFSFPASINGYPLKQPENHYFGFALSGYGVMLNHLYLQRWGLPQVSSWAELADPVFYSHLGLSSPSRSGTTHLMIEMILQQYGWQEGWKYILKIASNAVTITARSYGVPEGIQQGRFGLGLVIDFLARKIDSPDIAFVYASETHYLPASIALLKYSENQQEAVEFIRFVLSAEGQRLLQNPKIARLPIDPDLYPENVNHINPYSLAEKNTSKKFDARVSRYRYELINALFDHLITFQHKDLKRLRGKLIQAHELMEMHSDTNLQIKQELEHIELQLYEFPVSLEQSLSPDLLTELKLSGNSVLLTGFLPPPLATIKDDWIQKMIELENHLEKILSTLDETQ